MGIEAHTRLLFLVVAAFTVGGANPNSYAQPAPEPWNWTDEEIARAVNKVRAGRDLNPASWPGNARVAVLFSFDVDTETSWLRNGDTNVGGLSQGQYGSRVALGRILELLDEADLLPPVQPGSSPSRPDGEILSRASPLQTCALPPGRTHRETLACAASSSEVGKSRSSRV